MKRIFPIVLFVVFFSVICLAQSAVVIKENANLRGTATQIGKVVTVLPYGTEVEVIKQSGPWFLVQSPQYVGWLHGNTIEYGDRSSASALPTYYVPTPAPAPATIYPSRVYEAPAVKTPPATVSAPEPEEAVSSTPTAICNDGTVSYSLNRSGTCSHHGGVSSWMHDKTPSSPNYSSPSSSPGGTVHVRGYYRKDGTYVRPHTRSAPRRRN